MEDLIKCEFFDPEYIGKDLDVMNEILEIIKGQKLLVI